MCLRQLRWSPDWGRYRAIGSAALGFSRYLSVRFRTATGASFRLQSRKGPRRGGALRANWNAECRYGAFAALSRFASLLRNTLFFVSTAFGSTWNKMIPADTTNVQVP